MSGDFSGDGDAAAGHRKLQGALAATMGKDAINEWVGAHELQSPNGKGKEEDTEKEPVAELSSPVGALGIRSQQTPPSADASPSSGQSRAHRAPADVDLSPVSQRSFEDESKSEPANVVDQVAKLKKRGKAFLQGLVDTWATPSAAAMIHGSDDVTGEQRETQMADDRAAWCMLLHSWQNRIEVPSRRRLKNMCWRGIPSACRGEAWVAIIGNELKITRDLYKILSSRATSPSASDACSREESIALIEVDVPRTFPELQFFHGDGPMSAPLVNILKTYVSFRPDVGYIQGMSYIAAMLLLNLDDEFNAFVALANLLNSELYFTLFRDFRSGRSHLTVFDKLMQKHVPKVFDRFCSMNLTPDMYLYDWILTIFSRSFPLDIACRIWDCFLVEGQAFLFRAALGVLKLYELALLQSTFEQSLHFLNHIPKTIDERLLFQAIQGISITDKTLTSMLQREQQPSQPL